MATTMQDAGCLSAATLLTLKSIDLYLSISLVLLTVTDLIAGGGAPGAQFMLSGHGP
jgi:hypothetical protein